jgi:NAD(P)-dependent dehydrogenase (short-subunit alcohol dehydrogenase family)
MIERFAGRSAEARAKVIAEEPIGRMGTPDEITETVVWMWSDAAGFMVGHELVVDGARPSCSATTTRSRKP